jgi:hypothetical protein
MEKVMMNSSFHALGDKPDEIANRLINKAEYRDGLQEIAIGLLILTYVSVTFLPVVLNKGFFFYKAFNWGVLLLMPIAFGSQWVIKKVRGRYLIGKVGYVKLKPINRKRLGVRLGIILGSSFVIAVLAAVVTFRAVIATHGAGSAAHGSMFPPLSWLILVNGIAGGAIMVFRIRLLRYVIGGVIMAMMSILLAVSRVSLNEGLAILYGFAGLLSLISGCVVFFLFIRKPDEASE